MKKEKLTEKDYLPFQQKMLQTDLPISEVMEKLMSYDPTKKWVLAISGNRISGITEKRRLFAKPAIIEIEKISDVLLLSSRPRNIAFFDDGSNFYNIIKMRRAILGDEVSIIEPGK